MRFVIGIEKRDILKTIAISVAESVIISIVTSGYGAPGTLIDGDHILR